MPIDHTAVLITDPLGPAKATLVLAHGAGGGMTSHPLPFFADTLAHEGVRVIRFEFPYTRLSRLEGRRRSPDRPDVLLQSWREVIAEFGGGTKLFIGGKSMGGRVASMIADEAGVLGLVCLGYPFHPPGKPQQLRTRHLKALKTPALILQGERDPFGSPQDVSSYDLSPSIRIVWIADGDHSFKPRKQSGRTEQQNLGEVVSHIYSFVADTG